MIKKALSFVSVFVFSALSFSFAQGEMNSASVANRRTAIRYLQIAKQFAAEKLWSEASSNAKMGLAYDDRIADLWYVQAVSRMSLGEKKSSVLPLVVRALTDSEWVDYNREGARILYSDILCSTRQFAQALAVLDSEPFIYSADAEYIRAKVYYCLGDEDSVGRARSRIDAARRVYPADPRFAELFYTHEYQILRKGGVLNDSARSLSEAFALMIPLYKGGSPELEIYAAIFASNERTGGGDSKKIRMLKAFNSKDMKSPLYAVEALKASLLSEDAALDYFYEFSDKTVELFLLEDFASLLESDEARKEFAEYLNSYNGTVIIDTDGDLAPNMSVTYRRGRPQSIFYDENQDDENEWSASCDFGVPLALSMSENALNLEYSSWPYISAASYRMESLHADLRFTLIAETLAWTPFLVEPNLSILRSLGHEFFVPVLDESMESVSGNDLLRSALSYSIPSKERDGAVIQVSLLNGVAQIASYSVGEKIYAMAQFENGIPVSRKLDVDGDGLFETSEYYGFSRDSGESFITAGDEMQIITNLFGSPAQGTGFYVRKITVDRNGDTVPDFIEEYLPAVEGDRIPGKISLWDTDSDGRWDVQYKRMPSSADGIVREEANFYQPLTNVLVTVLSEDEIPVSVRSGGQSLSVTKGKNDNFYWLSTPGTLGDEESVLREIDRIAEQGVSLIVESGGKRFLSVRIEKMIFSMEIPDERFPDFARSGGGQ